MNMNLLPQAKRILNTLRIDTNIKKGGATEVSKAYAKNYIY